MSDTEIALTLDDPVAQDPNRVAKDLFAGTVGGIAQVLVGQPFDTTKVRLQSAPTGKYTGALDVVKRLLAQEGPGAFYKGTLTPLIGVGACVSVQFGVNESMKRFYNGLNKEEGKMTSSQYFISGTAAGFANGFLASPIEHIRIKLQTQTVGRKEFNGPLDVIKKLYQHKGIASIYKGIGPTLARESLGMGSYFTTFEALVKREMDTRQIKRNQVESWKLCVFGGLAGYAMWCTVYPLDVIKSLMQTDNVVNPKFKNSIEVTKFIWKEYGFKGFFKGFTPTILRAAPANAATFCAFELTIRALE